METKNENRQYSVLMPLYKGDNPVWFKYSLESILSQTVIPSEIIIICDGPLTNDLEGQVSQFLLEYNDIITVHRLPHNVGLGVALAEGVKLCSCELIARMDSDDYAVPNRCERQLEIFGTDPEVDVVGSNVEEFTERIDHVVSHVILPETNDDIVVYAKRRCPIRHPALMYRKSAVIKAGNYRDHRRLQDYDLIVHMIMSGAKFYNIQEPLMYMRVSPDFYKRRGGFKQAKLVFNLKKGFLDCGFYSVKDFLIAGVGNSIVCLLPNSIRKLIYRSLLQRRAKD